MTDRLTGPLRPLSTVITEPADRALSYTARGLAQLVRMITRHDWRGLSAVPARGGVIIVANHISNADPLMLSHFLVYAGRWPRFLAKASLFGVPLVGWVLKRCGQIPVWRGTATASSSLDAAVEAVEAGLCVVVYPEGTITDRPGLWPMAGRTGAARIALATGCPVVPVGQWGAQQILYGRRLAVPRLWPRATMMVQAGAPVDLTALRSLPVTQELLQQATAMMMEAVTVIVEELRGETRWPAAPVEPCS